MRYLKSCLAVLALCASLSTAQAKDTGSLSIGEFVVANWFACTNQKVAENIAQTFVLRGPGAAQSLFNLNSLICWQFEAPKKLYVNSVVWHREMHDGSFMKVVLMTEWVNDTPNGVIYYVLTLNPVIGSGLRS